MNPNFITKFVLHFSSESQPLVPEEEIRRIFQFLGLALICGRVDVPTFDQVANGLIKTCRGDFECELIETKTKIKFVLDQCQGEK